MRLSLSTHSKSLLRGSGLGWTFEWRASMKYLRCVLRGTNCESQVVHHRRIRWNLSYSHGENSEEGTRTLDHNPLALSCESSSPDSRSALLRGSCMHPSPIKETPVCQATFNKPRIHPLSDVGRNRARRTKTFSFGHSGGTWMGLTDVSHARGPPDSRWAFGLCRQCIRKRGTAMGASS